MDNIGLNRSRDLSITLNPTKTLQASTSSGIDIHNYNEWHILEVIPKILDIVMNPIKQQMMTRPCGQPHDHGEIRQQEMLADYCCKLVVRIVSELTSNATNVEVIPILFS